MILAELWQHNVFGRGPAPDAELWPVSCDKNVDMLWVIIVTDNQIPAMDGSKTDLDIRPKISLFEIVHRWHEVVVAALCYHKLTHSPFDMSADEAFLRNVELLVCLAVCFFGFIVPDDTNISAMQHLRQRERDPDAWAILPKHRSFPAFACQMACSKARSAARSSGAWLLADHRT